MDLEVWGGLSGRPLEGANQSSELRLLLVGGGAVRISLSAFLQGDGLHLVEVLLMATRQPAIGLLRNLCPKEFKVFLVFSEVSECEQPLQILLHLGGPRGFHNPKQVVNVEADRASELGVEPKVKTPVKRMLGDSKGE